MQRQSTRRTTKATNKPSKQRSAQHPTKKQLRPNKPQAFHLRHRPFSTSTQPTSTPIITTTIDPKTNIFASAPPKPEKSKEEEQIPDLPNYINQEYANGRKPIM